MRAGRKAGKTGKETVGSCPTCKKEFVRKSTNQTYCSRSCAAKAPKWKNAPPEREYGVCKTCGKSLKGCKGRRSFCSDACARAGEKKIWEDQRYTERYNHVCPQCGKTFRAAQANRKYCSRACKTEGFKKTMEDRAMAAANPEKTRSGETILVVVTRMVPVHREMMPTVGKTYAAVRYRGYGPDVVVIPEFGKFGLILRTGEYRVVKG